MVDSGKVTSTLLGIQMFDATEQNMEDILCSICNYTTNSQKNLIYHIVRQHRNDSNFHVICTFPHCFYSSRSWGAFKSNFSRQHRQRIDVGMISVPDDEHDNEISPICSSLNKMDMHCALNLMTLH